MFFPFRVKLIETTRYNGSPLCHQRCDKEVISDRSVTILFQEGHQKSETDVDHNMNILEHCEKKTAFIRLVKSFRKLVDTALVLHYLLRYWHN